jgi:hypothetical protein
LLIHRYSTPFLTGPSLHFTSLYFTALHFTKHKYPHGTLRFNPLYYTTLHYSSVHGVTRNNSYAEEAIGEWGTFLNEDLREVLLSLWNPAAYERREMLALRAERLC